MLGVLHGENITAGPKAQGKLEGEKTVKKVFDKILEIWQKWDDPQLKFVISSLERAEK
jgi:hypothetical protein